MQPEPAHRDQLVPEHRQRFVVALEQTACGGDGSAVRQEGAGDVEQLASLIGQGDRHTADTTVRFTAESNAGIGVRHPASSDLNAVESWVPDTRLLSNSKARCQTPQAVSDTHWRV